MWKKIFEGVAAALIISGTLYLVNFFVRSAPAQEKKVQDHEERLNDIDVERKMDKKLRCYMSKKVFKKDKEVVEACLGY